MILRQRNMLATLIIAQSSHFCFACSNSHALHREQPTNPATCCWCTNPLPFYGNTHTHSPKQKTWTEQSWFCDAHRVWLRVSMTNVPKESHIYLQLWGHNRYVDTSQHAVEIKSAMYLEVYVTVSLMVIASWESCRKFRVKRKKKGEYLYSTVSKQESEMVNGVGLRWL